VNRLRRLERERDDRMSLGLESGGLEGEVATRCRINGGTHVSSRECGGREFSDGSATGRLCATSWRSPVATLRFGASMPQPRSGSKSERTFATEAIIRVGDGRGFLLENLHVVGWRATLGHVVLTAAHCLPAADHGELLGGAHVPGAPRTPGRKCSTCCVRVSVRRPSRRHRSSRPT
jgi:hypothetical protein